MTTVLHYTNHGPNNPTDVIGQCSSACDITAFTWQQITLCLWEYRPFRTPICLCLRYNCVHVAMTRALRHFSATLRAFCAHLILLPRLQYTPFPDYYFPQNIQAPKCQICGRCHIGILHVRRELFDANWIYAGTGVEEWLAINIQQLSAYSAWNGFHFSIWNLLEGKFLKQRTVSDPEGGERIYICSLFNDAASRMVRWLHRTATVESLYSINLHPMKTIKGEWRYNSTYCYPR
jgi:hypothetical protein